MRIFESRRQPADPLQHLASQLDGSQEDCGRWEPDAIAPRRVPVDPYLVWAAQREAEREHGDSTQVRWVYRHPGGGTATVAN